MQPDDSQGRASSVYSAHSVHSTHSAPLIHSVHSAHSNPSQHSGHSLYSDAHSVHRAHSDHSVHSGWSGHGSTYGPASVHSVAPSDLLRPLAPGASDYDPSRYDAGGYDPALQDRYEHPLQPDFLSHLVSSQTSTTTASSSLNRNRVPVSSYAPASLSQPQPQFQPQPQSQPDSSAYPSVFGLPSQQQAGHGAAQGLQGDPKRQDSYDQFKKFLGLDKDALFANVPSPSTLIDEFTDLPFYAPGELHASATQSTVVQQQQQQQQQPPPPTQPPRSTEPVQVQPSQQSQSLLSDFIPNAYTQLDRMPEVSLGLDRLTFNFDPSGSDLAPLVLGDGQPAFPTFHNQPQTHAQAPPPQQPQPIARLPQLQQPQPKPQRSSHQSGVSEDLAAAHLTPDTLYTPSRRGSTQHRSHPYGGKHRRSPSAASDRSGKSPGTSPHATAPTTLPVPAPHSPGSASPSYSPSDGGSGRASRASLAESRASGSPASLRSGSVLSAANGASPSGHSGGSHRPTSTSHWSTSDAGGNVDLSLVDRPIHNLKVTTAKTKAASASRRKAAAPFKCPIPGCESSFTRALNLRGHLRSHTDERPYACRYCDRSFARAHDKRRHEKLHLNIRPHTCEYCGKMFARLDALNRHHRQEGDTCLARVSGNAASGVSATPEPSSDTTMGTTAAAVATKSTKSTSSAPRASKASSATPAHSTTTTTVAGATPAATGVPMPALLPPITPATPLQSVQLQPGQQATTHPSAPTRASISSSRPGNAFAWPSGSATGTWAVSSDMSTISTSPAPADPTTNVAPGAERLGLHFYSGLSPFAEEPRSGEGSPVGPLPQPLAPEHGGAFTAIDPFFSSNQVNQLPLHELGPMNGMLDATAHVEGMVSGLSLSPSTEFSASAHVPPMGPVGPPVGQDTGWTSQRFAGHVL